MNFEKFMASSLEAIRSMSWGIASGGEGAPSYIELSTWLTAFAFLGLVALYRKRKRPYASVLGFLGLVSLSALPLSPWFIALGLCPQPWALSVALQILAWDALLWMACSLSEYAMSAPRRWIFHGLSVVAAGALIATAFMTSGRLETIAALGSVAARLALGVGSIYILARHAFSRILARRAIPSLALWTAATLALILPIAGLAPYAAAAYAAAQSIVGIIAVALSLFELALPSLEDTAIDEYSKRLTISINKFIPAEFLAYLKKTDVADLVLGDHVKKDMTIFFSDIRAFTELSEALTPEESFAFINSYLSRVVPVITEHKGFVDKYMGDGIMALFSENGGSDDSIECAIAIQHKIQEYNGHRAKMGYRPIAMGIGIHTGPLMMGVVGVQDRMEGTVISDSVNLASRLQSIAKAFNIPLVISERTFMSLSDPGKYKYRFIGKVRVKGKDAPVSVFEIFDGLSEELFERKMRANTFFEQGMMAYYQKNFNDGVFYFKRGLEQMPEDGASRFYLEMCLRKSMAPRSV